jgi:multidrug efflux pump subunit AcrB
MLTRIALSNPMLMLALVLMAMVAGPYSFLSHPSREDPAITIRTAAVTAQFPGMPADKVEQLITSVLEEKIREIPEVNEINSTSSTGQALISVEVADQYTELHPIWTKLRDKMDEVVPDLPDGTRGPNVDTDKGDVAMATIALTADGYSNAEMHVAAKMLRRQLYASVPGVRKVTLYGVLEQQVFVEFDNIRMSQLGLDPNAIIAAVQGQNVIQPGGRVEVEGQTLTIQPSGDFSSLDELETLSVAIPNEGGRALYLRDIASVSLAYQDPPGPHAYYNGEEAIVIGVSMIDGFDANAFARALEAYLQQARVALPLGLSLDVITYQPDEIKTAVFGVVNNLWQTVLIVLAVVVAFLGLRTGLIVGSMVPLVMVVTILVMRWFGIDLERMSLASLIIALGLLVDNGIVVAEEMQARLARGDERSKAAKAVGAMMSGPLLAASLTTIFAFMPLMLMPGAAGEYTRSISLVVGIALLVSWVIALSALILFCVWFLRRGTPISDAEAYSGRYYRYYRIGMGFLVRWRWIAVPVAFATIALGVLLMAGVSKTFFPASERSQLQIVVELPVGANTYATREVVQRLSGWLTDREKNPEIVDAIGYVGTGGPRFYLSLSPIDGFPNKGYFIVNLQSYPDVDKLVDKVRVFAAAQIPEARITPKKMSMGPGEAGLVEYRLYGSNVNDLKRVADELQMAIRGVPGARDVKDDWENPSVTIRVIIDQEAARRAGVTSSDIAQALNAQLAGLQITDYRVGDLSIPVMVRAEGDARRNIDRLRTLNVARAGNAAVPLLQIADFEGAPQYSRIKRQNLERVVTVSAKHATDSAASFDARLAPSVAELSAGLPFGYRIERGGEIEDSGDANQKLASNMPLAFGLMVLVLIWQFNSFIKPALIISVIPLTITGVGLALVIAPGANFGFMSILGFLALMGIVINNAIILIDRIEEERLVRGSVAEAVVEAGVRRLRPIIMATCTTALGLAPIIIARDVLFYDLALVIAGGLLIGTGLTLVVIPCLYAMVYRDRPVAPA